MSATAQNMAALELANETRYRRAATLTALRQMSTRDGLTVAANILTQPAPHMAGMSIYWLLTSVRQYGRARVLPILRRARVSEIRPLGDLTVRQREALVAELGEGK